METQLSHLTPFRNFVPRHRDAHWFHHRWYMNTMCAVSLLNHLRAAADTFRTLRIQLMNLLSSPQRRDCQAQESFLAPSADKKTCNHDTERFSESMYVYATVIICDITRVLNDFLWQTKQ